MLMALTYAFDPPEVEGGLMKLKPRKPVTEASKNLIKERKAEGKVSLYTSFMRKFEKSDEESLVDFSLLSYSYIEAGSIQTIGCFTCYFYAMWYHYGLTPAKALEFGPRFVTTGLDDIGAGPSLAVSIY